MPWSELDAIVASLTAWLTTRLHGASDVIIEHAVRPTSNGASNETILADVVYHCDGRVSREGLVFRLRPQNRLFLDDQFDVQYRVLDMLQLHSAPTPRVRWYEEDPSFLGMPFWVMDRVVGEVPSDRPPYREVGFVHDADPDQRRQLWSSAVDTLAALHSLRLGHEELSMLDCPDLGPDGLSQEVARLRRHWEWASDGRAEPAMSDALSFLSSTPVHHVPGLSWGDARLGNMMFRNGRCVCLLDWEQVSLAGPLKDVAWWCYADKIVGAEPMSGFGSSAELVQRWSTLTGYPTTGFEWFEVLAGAWFVSLYARLDQLARQRGTPSRFGGTHGSGVPALLAQTIEAAVSREE